MGVHKIKLHPQLLVKSFFSFRRTKLEQQKQKNNTPHFTPPYFLIHFSRKKLNQNRGEISIKISFKRHK